VKLAALAPVVISSESDAAASIAAIRANSMRTGVAENPNQRIESISAFLKLLTLVLRILENSNTVLDHRMSRTVVVIVGCSATASLHILRPAPTPLLLETAGISSPSPFLRGVRN
jgi:hypothetical protein